MADQDEPSFVVADPQDAFLGFGDVRVTSTFASDEPDRPGRVPAHASWRARRCPTGGSSFDCSTERPPEHTAAKHPKNTALGSAAPFPGLAQRCAVN